MAATYRLEVVTPEGQMVDEQVESCIVRTTEGDMGILKGHADYMAAIDVGRIAVKGEDGRSRQAALSEGFVQISTEGVRVVVTTFEWSNQIDKDRAAAAKERATQKLADSPSPEMATLLRHRLHKERNRLWIAEE